MTITRPWFLLVAAALFLCGCADQPPGPDVVAVTDQGEVTRLDLETFILSLPETERGPSGNQDPAEWRREVLERMLVTRHLEEDARARKIGESEEATALTAVQTDALLIQEVEERVLRERVLVGEAELQEFYETHPEEFRRSEQVRLRHIFRRVDRDASPTERQAARDDMEGILNQLRGGANFEELAKAESDSETAPLGGLIGRVSRGTFPPDQERMFWQLSDGEISDIVATPVGFHVFRVDDHLEPEEKKLAEVRGVVTRRLIHEATERVRREYFDELLEASQAFYDPRGLTSGDRTTLLFELQDERLTLDEWWNALRGQSFMAQRKVSVTEQLDDWVRERLYLWEAENSGMAEESAIAGRIEGIRDGVALSLAYREKQTEVIEDFGERELLDHYEANRARFQSPRLFQIRLLTRTPQTGSGLYSIYEQLDSVADSIRAGELDFAEAARRWSEDPSSVDGGDVGRIRLDGFIDWAGPTAQKAVAAMEVGEISEPLLIERYDRRNLTYEREGYMLVEVLAIHPPAVRPFEDVRREVVRQVATARASEIAGRITDDTLDQIHARIYEGNL